TDTHPAQPEANPQDNDKLTRSAAPPPSYLDGPRPTVDEPGGPEARVSRALAGHSARSAKHPARFTAPDITGLTPADAIRLEQPITDTSVTETINNATQQATRQIQHTIGHPAGWGLTDTDILLTARTEGLPVWLTIAQGIADTLEHRVKLLIRTETPQPLEICPKST
ncbi:hypothetical protein, partial [Actinacidiphila sp. bgisy167]|uniref:hypothetical protein n=1 Tax=Actinacidiphila sp. bgisy167 TaxID=3413797 RepID=UPI003D719BA9